MNWKFSELINGNIIDMVNWFTKRTFNHKQLVYKYCELINNYDPEKFEGILKRGNEHDISKYEEPEIEPYIYLSWDYKCKKENKKFNLPEQIKDEINKATLHHIKNNSHHPEYHFDKINQEIINRDNRDLPSKKIIDSTKMKDLDIAEMVADWCAMSEELGNNPIDWADKKVNVKWKFNDKQKKLIYELLNILWVKQ